MLRKCSRCNTEKPLTEFYVRKNGAINPWCKSCYREWYRGRHVLKAGANDDPRDCACCGSSYRPKNRRPSEFCSRKCKDDANKARLAEERLLSKPIGRECLHCGTVLPQSMRVDAIFCSEDCNSNAHSLQRKLRMRTGQDNKPGYLRLVICKRDGWRCGICHDRVNPTLEYPHPRCASLDHIIPVSKGGLSEPANLRLVHLVCNLQRRNVGVSEQLALI